MHGLGRLFLALLLLGCAGCVPRPGPGDGKPPAAPKPPPRIAIGVNYADWSDAFGSDASGEALADLRDLGITDITYVPTWYQESTNATEILRLEGVTPRDEQLVLDMRRARAMGFSIGLNLHIDLYDGTARSRIAFKTAADFETWWQNYERIVMQYALIAGENELEHFSVGCELSGVAVPPYTEHWRALIANVRRHLEPHGGRVTYTARHQNLANLDFLGDLDFIGVNLWPYFDERAVVSVESMRSSWRRARYFSEDFATLRADTNSYAAVGYEMDVFAYLRWISELHERPISITEFGCQSRQGALRRPVEWQAAGNPDVLGQALYYEGFLQELRADARAHAAASAAPYPIESVVLWNYMIKDAGPTDTDYSFRNKPLTERVLRRFLEEQD